MIVERGEIDSKYWFTRERWQFIEKKRKGKVAASFSSVMSSTINVPLHQFFDMIAVKERAFLCSLEVHAIVIEFILSGKRS